MNVHLGADLKARWTGYCVVPDKLPDALLKDPKGLEVEVMRLAGKIEGLLNEVEA